jgi:succinyl-CoA synthetase beta subunit
MGKIVNKVYLTEAVEPFHEYYVSITIDRNLRRPVLIISSEGGTNIETIAKQFPEKLHKIIIEITSGLNISQIKEIAYKMGLSNKQADELSSLLSKLYALFLEKDCSLVEINPLVLTKDGHFLAIDSKINFDDNAIIRHPDIEKLRDVDEENPKETKAISYNLNYIPLDGDIACLVNGAGLAMATMDIIKYYGGRPANFLDIGGRANEEQIIHALEIILGNQNIKGILINIFGGIVKCDTVAQGIINAAQAINLTLPLVVRLEGTNVERGKQLLKESGLKTIFTSDLDEAARQIVTQSQK